MQDKEFDMLFQQRFELFEVEPLSESKNNIFKILKDKSEDERSYQSYWAVAATIAVLISIGTWFSNPGEKIKLYGKIKVEERVEESRIVIPQVETVKESTAEKVTVAMQEKERITQYFKPNPEAEIEVLDEEREEEKAYQELKHEGIKTFGKQEENLKVEEQAFVSTSNSANEHWIMEDNDAEMEVQALTKAARNHNSVGDLVNFVISKVDKRKNKIIEFTDTDEGSIVSGINLGFVRFKSKQ